MESNLSREEREALKEARAEAKALRQERNKTDLQRKKRDKFYKLRIEALEHKEKRWKNHTEDIKNLKSALELIADPIYVGDDSPEMIIEKYRKWAAEALEMKPIKRGRDEIRGRNLDSPRGRKNVVN